MKKGILTILSLLLMASSAFGSDVLFKMVAISSAAVSCTNEEKDLSPYAVVIGGEAKIGTASESAKNLVVVQSSSSYVRLDGGYLHVTLPRALKAGDKIYFTTYGEETKTLYLTNSSTRNHWEGTAPNEISPATNFEVNSTFATSAGRMNNSKDLYFHYGLANAPYIKSLVITGDEDANVKDYLFDGLDATTYSNATTDIFGGDIVVHSKSSGSKIQALWGTNVFYTNGAGKDRELEVKVNGPCDIDVYAVSPTGEAIIGRKLHLSDDNSNSSALIKAGTDIITIDANNLAKVAKGSSEYNSFAPHSVYISTSTGAWNIAAIRVTYKSSDVQTITANNCTMAGGDGSSNGIIWTSTTGNNITFANESPNTTNPIAKTTDGANFTIVASRGLRLASSRTYTVSVPSNQVIVAAYVEAYSHGSATNAKINVNGAGWSAELPNHTAGVAPTKIYSAVNASSFTLVTNSTNSLVEIKLLTEELDYYPVSISGGWASFCAPEDVELPAGVNAYIASTIDGDVLNIEDAEVTTIPANTGVLLYSESDGDYHLTATTGAADLSSGFAGTIARTANPNTSTTYSLYDNNGTIEFWNYTGNYIPANKAYLVYAGAGAPGRTLRVQVRPKVPTAAESIQNSDISSQKVIANGQLVIIREGVKYNVVGQIVK